MANGPLGGFMPTPAAPAQPPQVKLDTTADSRGNFNNFLKSMNGALSVNPPVMAPAMGAMTPNIAPASDIDIFNQPQNFFFGGAAMSGGDFSDADIGSQIDSFDDSPPDSDMDYTDVFDSDDLQQATNIGKATSENTEPLVLQPGIVAPGIGAPKEFEPMFPNTGIKIGNFTIPSIFSLGNYVSNLSRGRVLDSIAEKGYTPVYGGKNNDVVVGARDPKTGILMEGMDPNEMLGSDDNNTDPIIKNTIKPIVEEEKDDDKPPNVIGGEEPKPIVPTDTSSVVASPFAPSTSTIDPVSFDAGELNKLIEMLTGVPAKPIVSKQEGGLVSAVDEFLASAS